ncbi:hypothetical protein F4780DRAFT_182288 [Xylariomycetidae sp. FL0641]|nr:hypothetical protein F4780DRAFT_182288 [Xylariomycetidae sp. FL0641]
MPSHPYPFPQLALRYNNSKGSPLLVTHRPFDPIVNQTLRFRIATMAQPTSSEGAAPSNPSGSPGPSQQPSKPEISQLRQRINRLQQVQQLTEQISVLKKSIGTARHSKRKRDDSDSKGSQDVNLKRSIRTFTLRFTYRQRDEWLANLRRAFDSAPRKYRKPRRYINLAVSKIDSQCRPLWDRKVQRAHDEDPTNAARIQAD